MPSARRSHRRDINKKDFNLLVFVIFIVAFFGSIFMAWNMITAGIIYSLMFVGTWSSIGMIFFWISDDRRMKPITDYALIPIASSMPLAAFFFLVSLTIPIFIQLLLGLFSSPYNVTQLAVPLFGAQIRTSLQSFSVAQIGSSMPWKIFTICFSAGANETLTYNFGLVLIGVICGLFLYSLLTDKKEINLFGIIPVSKRFFVMAFAQIFAFAGFGASHVLNQTYSPANFVFAVAFLFVANMSIYFGGAFLSFWIGYHMSNNFVWLVQVEGFGAVMMGFVSLFGAFFIPLILLLINYVVRHWDAVMEDFGNWV